MIKMELKTKEDIDKFVKENPNTPLTTEMITKKVTKKCYKCKKKIIDDCVCCWYVTHICEEGDEYECPNCFLKYVEEKLDKEKYLTKNLKKIIMEKMGSY